MKNRQYDLIILGGGLVGLTLANLCAKNDFFVALVEAQKLPAQGIALTEKPSSLQDYDIRCSAITRGSQNIFQVLKIWECMRERASPYQHMVVWDALGFGEIRFDAAEVGEPNLGYIIENRVMLKALWEKASENSNLDIFTEARAIEFKPEIDHMMLLLDNDIVLKAKLMVGAEGANSWLRDKAQVTTIKRAYHQSALIANIETELPHQNTACQRFLKEGPLALLPLSEPNRCSIVWTATPETTEHHVSLTEALFCAELAHSFDYRLGKILAVGQRQAFPLFKQQAKNYVLERIALLGDAAHVIHPLAGQGVNLGLLDAAALSEVLTLAKKEDYDIGHRLVLRKYERARKGHVLQMMAAMDVFKHLWGSENSGIIHLRSLGLNWINQSPKIKKALVMKALTSSLH